METIILYGELRERFGREFKLDIQDMSEAIRALCVVVPGFKAYLQGAHRKGFGFKVYVDKRPVNGEKDARRNPQIKEEIRIVPRVFGAGGNGGIFQIIIGVILIGVGFFAFGTTSAAGVSLIAGGIGAAVGGLVSMLMPTSTAEPDSLDSKNKPSYGFGQARTTTAQGYPIGLIYGRRTTGGALLSGGILTEDQA